ncbi:MAG TPA: hypothetical protein VI756_25955 [Blastocatellia bacterium]
MNHRTDRPTGIIRTLPSLYGDASVGAKEYQHSIRGLERGSIDSIGIALPGMPRLEVLYIYLVVNGKVDVRLNIAGYEPGEARQCWDHHIRSPKVWAVVTGPVVRPPEVISYRGFQGFRYCGSLWEA